MLISVEDYQLRFGELYSSRQIRFFYIVRRLLEDGIKPTPKVINQALLRFNGRSLNGVECKIRANLLQVYGYELVGRYWRKGPLEL